MEKLNGPLPVPEHFSNLHRKRRGTCLSCRAGHGLSEGRSLLLGSRVPVGSPSVIQCFHWGWFQDGVGQPGATRRWPRLCFLCRASCCRRGAHVVGVGSCAWRGGRGRGRWVRFARVGENGGRIGSQYGAQVHCTLRCVTLSREWGSRGSGGHWAPCVAVWGVAREARADWPDRVAGSSDPPGALVRRGKRHHTKHRIDCLCFLS